eukprot:TRINITY_DN11145_c0_g1_i1.p1 TRINITY_DN11145_c0_g1~~TRINITY_DN11145_c0_g1_i1.p1  ORF type:complete len:1019 (+),score=179.54 TRINITY_DN11145_c0_g1_i1:65-3121(+)
MSLSMACVNITVAVLNYFKSFVQSNSVLPLDDVGKQLWNLAVTIRRQLKPEESRDGARIWFGTKGLLKELIDFDSFNPGYATPCTKPCDEKFVVLVLERYLHYLQSGGAVVERLETYHPAPDVLHETEGVLVLDKPVNFTCSFGSHVPTISGARDATALLNSKAETVQIHEWVARKFNFETASKTREFWATNPTKVICEESAKGCQACENCGFMIAGCANRLDVQTSGILLVAKTGKAFVELRQHFGSKAEANMQKHYLALVHGNVPVSDADSTAGRSKDRWEETRVPMKWDEESWMSLPWTQADDVWWKALPQKEKEQYHRDNGGRQEALTYYRPLAHYGNDFTLLQLQIITGRRHQIRFHCQQLGHPLLADSKYGAPASDRALSRRIFLHSYMMQFRDPINWQCLEVIAPLPRELSQVLVHLAHSHGQVVTGLKDRLLSHADRAELRPLIQRKKCGEKLHRVIPEAGLGPCKNESGVGTSVDSRSKGSYGAGGVPRATAGGGRDSNSAAVESRCSWKATADAPTTKVSEWTLLESRTQPGKSYWWNDTLKKTALHSGRPGWIMHESTTQLGKSYFECLRTGETVWSLPNEEVCSDSLVAGGGNGKSVNTSLEPLSEQFHSNIALTEASAAVAEASTALCRAKEALAKATAAAALVFGGAEREAPSMPPKVSMPEEPLQQQMSPERPTPKYPSRKRPRLLYDLATSRPKQKRRTRHHAEAQRPTEGSREAETQGHPEGSREAETQGHQEGSREALQQARATAAEALASAAAAVVSQMKDRNISPTLVEIVGETIASSQAASTSLQQAQATAAKPLASTRGTSNMKDGSISPIPVEVEGETISSSQAASTAPRRAKATVAKALAGATMVSNTENGSIAPILVEAEGKTIASSQVASTPPRRAKATVSKVLAGAAVVSNTENGSISPILVEAEGETIASSQAAIADESVMDDANLAVTTDPYSVFCNSVNASLGFACSVPTTPPGRPPKRRRKVRRKSLPPFAALAAALAAVEGTIDLT